MTVAGLLACNRRRAPGRFSVTKFAELGRGPTDCRAWQGRVFQEDVRGVGGGGNAPGDGLIGQAVSDDGWAVSCSGAGEREARHTLDQVQRVCDWLVDGYLSAYSDGSSPAGRSQRGRGPRGAARFGVDSPTVYVRVGRDPEDSEANFYLDLGDHAGNAVESAPNGWDVIQEPNIHFKRPRGQLRCPSRAMKARSSYYANL